MRGSAVGALSSGCIDVDENQNRCKFWLNILLEKVLEL